MLNSFTHHQLQNQNNLVKINNLMKDKLIAEILLQDLT